MRALPAAFGALALFAAPYLVPVLFPGELYARAWLHPLKPEELAERMRTAVPS